MACPYLFYCLLALCSFQLSNALTVVEVTGCEPSGDLLLCTSDSTLVIELEGASTPSFSLEEVKYTLPVATLTVSEEVTATDNGNSLYQAVIDSSFAPANVTYRLKVTQGSRRSKETAYSPQNLFIQSKIETLSEDNYQNQLSFTESGITVGTDIAQAFGDISFSGGTVVQTEHGDRHGVSTSAPDCAMLPGSEIVVSWPEPITAFAIELTATVSPSEISQDLGSPNQAIPWSLTFRAADGTALEHIWNQEGSILGGKMLGDMEFSSVVITPGSVEKCIDSVFWGLSVEPEVTVVVRDPSKGYSEKQNFVKAGQYTFTVPEGVDFVDALLWGGGGGSGAPYTSTSSLGEVLNYGGAGAYTYASIPVTPGETLSLFVAEGGKGATGDFCGGGGGGSSAVGRLEGSTWVETLVVAAGGGGGASMLPGGAAGAYVGVKGGGDASPIKAGGGEGATQETPGAGGQGAEGLPAGGDGQTGIGGAAGVFAGAPQTAGGSGWTNGGSGGCIEGESGAGGGGGGGAGWRGGGAGGAGPKGGGGAGGSSWFPNGNGISGSGFTPASTGLEEYGSKAGVGGGDGADGKGGRIVLLFTPAGTVPATCGDGIVSESEQCDDNNSRDGDGCNKYCLIEPGYECKSATPGATSMCSGCDTPANLKVEVFRECTDCNGVSSDVDSQTDLIVVVRNDEELFNLTITGVRLYLKFNDRTPSTLFLAAGGPHQRLVDSGEPYELATLSAIQFTSGFTIPSLYDAAKGLYRVYVEVDYVRYANEELQTYTSAPAVAALVGNLAMSVNNPTTSKPVQLGAATNPLPSFTASVSVLLTESINPPVQTTKTESFEDQLVVRGSINNYGYFYIPPGGKLSATVVPKNNMDDPDLFVNMGANATPSSFACSSAGQGVENCVVQADSTLTEPIMVQVVVFGYSAVANYDIDILYTTGDTTEQCSNDCPAAVTPTTDRLSYQPTVFELELIGTDLITGADGTRKTVFQYQRSGSAYLKSWTLGSCVDTVHSQNGVAAPLQWNSATGVYGHTMDFTPGSAYTGYFNLTLEGEWAVGAIQFGVELKGIYAGKSFLGITRGPVKCPAGSQVADLMTLSEDVFNVRVGEQLSVFTSFWNVRTNSYKFLVSSPKQKAPGAYDLTVSLKTVPCYQECPTSASVVSTSQEQAILYSSGTTTFLDYVLVIDSSASMIENDPDSIRTEVGANIIDLSRDGDAAGVVRFNNEGYLLFPLTTLNVDTRVQAKDQIATIGASGTTNILSGLSLAEAQLERSTNNNPKVVIVMTDGEDSPQRDIFAYEALLQKFEKQNWKIHTIGLSPEASSEKLTAIATRTGGQYRFASDAGELQAIYDAVFAASTGDTILFEDVSELREGEMRASEITLDSYAIPATLTVLAGSASENAAVATQLLTPSGEDSSSDMNIQRVVRGQYIIYQLGVDASPGTYLLSVGLESAPLGVTTVQVRAKANSAVTLSATTSTLSYYLNDPVLIKAHVIDDEARKVLRDVTVTAEVVGPNGDSVEVDVHPEYGAYYVGTGVEGNYNIFVTAKGIHDCTKEPYVRRTQLTVTVKGTRTTLLRYEVESPNKNPDTQAIAAAPGCSVPFTITIKNATKFRGALSVTDFSSAPSPKVEVDVNGQSLGYTAYQCDVLTVLGNSTLTVSVMTLVGDVDLVVLEYNLETNQQGGVLGQSELIGQVEDSVTLVATQTMGVRYCAIGYELSNTYNIKVTTTVPTAAVGPSLRGGQHVSIDNAFVTSLLTGAEHEARVSGSITVPSLTPSGTYKGKVIFESSGFFSMPIEVEVLGLMMSPAQLTLNESEVGQATWQYQLSHNPGQDIGIKFDYDGSVVIVDVPAGDFVRGEWEAASVSGVSAPKNPNVTGELRTHLTAQIFYYKPNVQCGVGIANRINVTVIDTDYICVPEGCSGHGECVQYSNPQPGVPTQQGECKCDEGWFGPACDKTCSGEPPCNGKGSCFLNELGEPTCSCHLSTATGYWGGDLCTECAPGFFSIEMGCQSKCPGCSGHGTCLETIVEGGQMCRCEDNYFGTLCEQPCPGLKDDSACNGHGTCDDGWNATGQCSCQPQWHSLSCDQPCPGLLNGAVCSDRGNCTNAVCTCEVSFRGDNCEKQCPGPVGIPCFGNGQCDLSADCTCDPGKWGLACEGTCPGGDNICSGHGTCFDGAMGNGSCSCEPGYFGTACQSECPGGAQDPCTGRGTCDDGSTGSGVCACSVPGYFGTACEKPCAPSADNVCNANGICDDGSSGSGECLCYRTSDKGHWGGDECTDCLTGFWGASCTESCLNCNGRGQCRDGLLGDGGCDCIKGTFGKSCNGTCPGGLDNVCNGQGTCEDGDGGSGLCTCNPGFYGEACQFVCLPALPFADPCYGSGVCDDGRTGSGNCSCSAQYRGVDCGQKCPGSSGATTVCSSHGECSDFAECTCDEYYFGRDCSGKCPETFSGVCNGHGTCSDGASGSGQCTCDSGYFGQGCETACPAYPDTCSGHGSCQDGRDGSGVCICTSGYGGADCSSECPGGAANPCDNHGTCLFGKPPTFFSFSTKAIKGASAVTTASDATCTCFTGKAGYWALDTAGSCTNCASNFWGADCKGWCTRCYFGTCNDGTGGDGTCICDSGVFGPNCAQDCPGGREDPCSSHGTCDDGATGTGLCTCEKDFWGSTCRNRCPLYGTTQGVCNGNGECFDGRTGNGTCNCNLAFRGVYCEFQCPGPADNPCNGNGYCDEKGTCQCEPGFFGNACENKCPAYEKVGSVTNVCSTHGTCDDGFAGSGKCTCDSGYYNTSCSQLCPGDGSCSGHGECDDGRLGSGLCDCEDGYWSPPCDKVCPGPVGKPCNLHGTCRDNIDGDGTCQCFSSTEEGYWKGEACDVCQDNAFNENCTGLCPTCSFRGTCSSGLTGDGSCTCEPGYFGSNCENVCPWTAPANSLQTGNFALEFVCNGQGECDDGAKGSGNCTCKPDYYGHGCENPCPGLLNEPSAVCSNKGTCFDGAQGNGTCACEQGYRGDMCQFKCPGPVTSPCYSNGWCDEVAFCHCQPGFFGADCYNECPLASGAHCNEPHGSCGDGAYGNGTCTCDYPFATQNCGKPCAGYNPEDPDAKVCGGHGMCDWGASGTGLCTCEPGYYGEDCTMTCPPNVTNPCNMHGECFDGRLGDGTCKCHNNPQQGQWVGAVCDVCKDGWYGPDCRGKCPTCSNRGVCSEGLTGDGSCTCEPGFWGLNCENDCPGEDNNCNGHGICSDGNLGDGSCTCTHSFHGVDCSSQCPGSISFSTDQSLYNQTVGTTGPFFEYNGTVCTTHGICDDGAAGTGNCSCGSGWRGQACHVPCPGILNGTGDCHGHGECDALALCTCEPAYFSPGCSQLCPQGSEGTCAGHGVCHDGAAGNGTCTCEYGFFSENCGEPCPAYPDVCSGHGTCNWGRTGTGLCTCQPGWFGADCSEECPGGFDTPCNGNGICDDGASGTGLCECFSGATRGFWEGTDCTVCQEGVYNPTCTGICNPCVRGTCNDGLTGDGNCTCPSGTWNVLCEEDCPGSSLTTTPLSVCNGHGVCGEGWNGNGHCECEPDFFGLDCGNKCPTASNGEVCNAHGICEDGRLGSGECTCDQGFNGASCENECPGPNRNCSSHGICQGQTCECFASFFGFACGGECPKTEGAVCAGHGVCNDTSTGNGKCTCEPGYFGPGCDMECPGGADNACNLQGACNDGAMGSGLCTCFSNYFGEDCGGECGPAASNSCNHNGKCFDGRAGNGTCKCFADQVNGFWTSCATPEMARTGLGNSGFPCTNGGVDALCTYDCGCEGSPGDSPWCCGGSGDMCLKGVCTPRCKDPVENPCSVCHHDVYGPNCTSHCHCVLGDCNDGTEGDGSCTCEEGVWDTHCDKECPGGRFNICHGHGECAWGSTAEGTCTCEPGWWGEGCDNPCPGNLTCSGHGMCDDGAVGSGNCTCDRGYKGPDCSIQCNGPPGIPCHDNGVCLDLGDCVCDPDFWMPDCGERCPETNGHVCNDHGTCFDGATGNGTCHCTDAGWFGGKCDQECPGGVDNICSGHGECHDGEFGSGLCTCQQGYWGEACENTCAPSATEPCNNNGECDDGRLGTGTCSCFGNWTKSECDDCIPSVWGAACQNPCQECYNGGSCMDGVAGDGHCICESGYFGGQCGSECPGGAPTPCNNHGTCDDGYRGTGLCTCDKDYYGQECSPCPGKLEDAVCSSHGACFDTRLGNGTCACDAGWRGDECTIQCPGGGTCSDAGVCDEHARCHCDENYYKNDCSGECPRTPLGFCNGHGVCDDGVSGNGTCTCEYGWWGPACDRECKGGAANPCNGNGHCLGDLGEGACVCSYGWWGEACNNPCPGGSEPGSICSGHGFCNMTGSCLCEAADEQGYWMAEACTECLPGYYGDDCKGVCQSCSYRGTCQDGRTSDGTCQCIPNVWGESCQFDCPGGQFDPCTGHGTCDDGATGSGNCTCQPGWFSADCSIPCPGMNVDNTTWCSTHGTCDDGHDGTGRCSCDTIHGGVDCSLPCPGITIGTTVCNGNGKCDTWPVPACECDAFYYGADCINVCPGTNTGFTSTCSGHGMCDDGDEGSGACTCDPYWATEDCSVPCPGGTTNATACSGHGVCTDGASGNGFCECDAGYFGLNCSEECPGGANNACSMHGVCDDGRTGSGLCECHADYEELGFWNLTACTECADDFFSPSCTGICDVCVRGSCNDGINGTGHCDCPAGTWGQDCGEDCPGGMDSPCSGHGTCSDMWNGTGVCTCKPGFFGPACQDACPGNTYTVNATISCSSNGVCDDGHLGTGDCTCNISYRGVDCGLKCPGPVGDPCHSNGQCNSNASCVCKPSYFGPDCAEQCSCSGHGECFDGATGNGTCTCDVGWFGTSCEHPCPGGASNPCNGHGQCDDGVYGSGICTCDDYYWGEECAGACLGGVTTPCMNSGTCDDGRNGTGECTCYISADLGFFEGGVCENCLHSYFGESCKNLCDNCNGRGNCSWGKTGTGMCECMAGTYGRFCESDCPGGFNNSCYGHGVCSDGRNGTGACECEEHYFGAGCKDLCPATENGICNSKGTCFDGALGNGTCACEEGWRGPSCAFPCPGVEKDAAACYGHGTCTPEASCICESDFWGLDCENPCPSHNDLPCGGPNRGACYDGAMGNGTCTCKPGFFGLACEGECPGGATNPCNGNGRCVDGVFGSGECVCNVEWSGDACDDCSSGRFGETCDECPGGWAIPCNGNGNCSDLKAGTGMCTCEQGWGGVECINECPGGWQDPCTGHGLCIEQGTKCECELGFAGTDCSIECPGMTHVDSRRSISFWGGGVVGVLALNHAGCCHSSYNDSIASWHQAFSMHIIADGPSPSPSPSPLSFAHNVTEDQWFLIASATTQGGMLFAEDYLNGKTHPSGDFILGCGNFSSLGSNFTIKVTMGLVTDFFKPRNASMNLCDMLTSSVNHLWSPSIYEEFVQPKYFTTTDYMLGGSARDWPRTRGNGAPGTVRQVCGGNGVCNDGADGDGTCLCDTSTGHFKVMKGRESCSQCEAGWYGPHCDQQCTGCNEPHGTCNDGIDGDGACYCKPGYYGPTCLATCRPSIDEPCNNHGVCDDGFMGSGACACEPGWKGVTCELECPGGADNICNGNGVCVWADADVDSGVALCKCSGMFYGEACENIIEEVSGQCSQYSFTNSLLPEQSPDSPSLFSSSLLQYRDAVIGGRAVNLVPEPISASAGDYGFLMGFTVSSWLRVVTTEGCSNGCPIAGRMHMNGTAGSFGYLMSVVANADGTASLDFTVANGMVMPSTTVAHTAVLPTNTPVYVAVAFHAESISQGVLMLCIDEACESTNTTSGLMDYSPDSLFLLGGNISGMTALQASVDELWVCNYAMDSDDANKQYEATKKTPKIVEITYREGSPRGGLSIHLLGEGFDPTRPVTTVWVGDKAVTPSYKNTTAIAFVTPTYSLPRDVPVQVPIKLYFGLEGADNFVEAECAVAQGCVFTYQPIDVRTKICHEWSFETSDPSVPLEMHSKDILSVPAAVTAKSIESPYNPSGELGTYKGLNVKDAPYIYAETQHLNYADFSMGAWIRIPQLFACGNNGGGDVKCSVAGRFTPTFPGSTFADDWYHFGYLLSVTNESSVDGQYHAMIEIGNGPFVQHQKLRMTNIPILPGQWFYLTASFNSARYSGANFGALSICVTGECVTETVRSNDVLGYRRNSEFNIGGATERDYAMVGDIDELFICNYPLTRPQVYEKFISYFKGDPNLAVSVEPVKDQVNPRRRLKLQAAANKETTDFVWTIKSPSNFKLTPQMVVGGKMHRSSLRLERNVMRPGFGYVFQVCANATKLGSGEVEHACAEVVVNVAPKPVIGEFTCETAFGEKEGSANGDKFFLKVNGAKGVHPLKYHFEQQTVNDAAVDKNLGDHISLSGGFTRSPTLTMRLPAGAAPAYQLNLRATLLDKYGNIESAICSVIVNPNTTIVGDTEGLIEQVLSETEIYMDSQDYPAIRQAISVLSTTATQYSYTFNADPANSAVLIDRFITSVQALNDTSPESASASLQLLSFLLQMSETTTAQFESITDFVLAETEKAKAGGIGVLAPALTAISSFLDSLPDDVDIDGEVAGLHEYFLNLISQEMDTTVPGEPPVVVNTTHVQAAGASVFKSDLVNGTTITVNPKTGASVRIDPTILDGVSTKTTSESGFVVENEPALNVQVTQPNSQSATTVPAAGMSQSQVGKNANVKTSYQTNTGNTDISMTSETGENVPVPQSDDNSLNLTLPCMQCRCPDDMVPGSGIIGDLLDVPLTDIDPTTLGSEDSVDAAGVYFNGASGLTLTNLGNPGATVSDFSVAFNILISDSLTSGHILKAGSFVVKIDGFASQIGAGSDTSEWQIAAEFEPYVWQAIAITKAGENMMMYVNGELWSTAPGSLSLQGGDSVHLMGGPTAESVRGHVSDLKIFSSALTEVEVQALTCDLSAKAVEFGYYNTTTKQFQDDGLSDCQVGDGQAVCMSNHATPFNILEKQTSSQTTSPVGPSPSGCCFQPLCLSGQWDVEAMYKAGSQADPCTTTQTFNFNAETSSLTVESSNQCVQGPSTWTETAYRRVVGQPNQMLYTLNGVIHCTLVKVDNDKMVMLENLANPSSCPASFDSRPAAYVQRTTSAADNRNSYFIRNCGNAAPGVQLTPTPTPTPTNTPSVIPMEGLPETANNLVLDEGLGYFVQAPNTVFTGTTTVNGARLVGSSSSESTLLFGSDSTGTPGTVIFDTPGMEIKNIKLDVPGTMIVNSGAFTSLGAIINVSSTGTIQAKTNEFFGGSDSELLLAGTFIAQKGHRAVVHMPVNVMSTGAMKLLDGSTVALQGLTSIQGATVEFVADNTNLEVSGDTSFKSATIIGSGVLKATHGANIQFQDSDVQVNLIADGTEAVTSAGQRSLLAVEDTVVYGTGLIGQDVSINNAMIRVDMSMQPPLAVGINLKVEPTGVLRFERVRPQATPMDIKQQLEIQGQIQVQLYSQYIPKEGDRIKIITYTSYLMGGPITVNLDQSGNGLGWSAIAETNANDLEIVFIPAQPSPTPLDGNVTPEDSGLGGGAIAAIIIGVVAVLTAAAIGGVVLYKQRGVRSRKSVAPKSLSTQEERPLDDLEQA